MAQETLSRMEAFRREMERNGYADELRDGGTLIIRHYQCGISIPYLNKEVFGDDAEVEFTEHGLIAPESIPYAVPGWDCGYCGTYVRDGRVPKCPNCAAPREEH